MPATTCDCATTIRDLEARLVDAKGGKVLVNGSWMLGVEATKKELATALALHAYHAARSVADAR